jgi:hypothetical protein
VTISLTTKDKGTPAPTVLPTLAPAPGVTVPPAVAPTDAATVAPPTTAPPTKAPTQAPTKCTSRDCLLRELLLQNEVSGPEALQDPSSPQFRALRWLANDDPMVLDLDSTPTPLVERYVLAVLYFATSGEGWGDLLNFLSLSSVCEWNNGQTQDCTDFRGAGCNEDDLVVDLDLRKSKHEEVLVLISKYGIDSPVYFPRYFPSGTTNPKGSIPSELGTLTSLTLLRLCTCIW